MSMNKIALVTGGAGGIGRAVTARLAQDQHVVILLDVNGDAGEEVAAEIRKRGLAAEFQRVDVSRETEVEASFEKLRSAYSRIDVLVNVAGGSVHRHPLADF